MGFGVISFLALFSTAFQVEPPNDIVATSANGTLRFEARTKDVSRFPKGYIYSLCQIKPEKVLWTCKQKEEDLPPWAAWVSDEGRRKLLAR